MKPGRKKKEDKKITYSTRLRPDQIAWLRTKQNAAKFIENLFDECIKKEGKNEN